MGLKNVIQPGNFRFILKFKIIQMTHLNHLRKSDKLSHLQTLRPIHKGVGKILLCLFLFSMFINSKSEAQKYESVLYEKSYPDKAPLTYLKLLRNSVVFYQAPVISNPHYLSCLFLNDFFFKIEGFPQPDIGVTYTITKHKIEKKGIRLITSANIFFPAIANNVSFTVKMDSNSINLRRRIVGADEVPIKSWGSDVLLNDSLGLSKVVDDIDIIRKKVY